MRQGTITICWEIKEEGRIAVAVEMPEQTKRLPLIFRRRIVTRLREMLIPSRGDRHA